MQVVGAAVDVFLHQRHADPLGDAAMDLAFDLGRIDGAADVVRGVDVQQRHRAELDVDLDLGDLRRERVGRVRHALAVGVERHRRRIEMAGADEQVGMRHGACVFAASRRCGQGAQVERALFAAAAADQAIAVEGERDVGIGAIAEAEPLDQLPAQVGARALGGVAGDEGLARRRRLAGVRRQVGVAHHLLDARRARGRPRRRTSAA